MKTKLLLISLCSFISCTNELDNKQLARDITDIIVTGKDFQLDKQSRTNLKITSSGTEFTWAADDTIGIYPNEGAQAYFPMLKGSGTKTASFTGGGWALKPVYNYAAYYPFIGNFYLNKTDIPIIYKGQKQPKISSTAHLGKYDYMAAVAKTPEQGKVIFDFNHLGALVELNITIPMPGNYSNVILECDNAVFPLEGKVDLTSSNPEFVLTKPKSNRMIIDLCNVHIPKKNTKIKVYFMSAPTNLTGKNINVYVEGECGYSGVTKADNLLAGYAYSFTVTDRKIVSGQWIDLGLPSGILWASTNLGASNVEESGDHFAWGEISPKPSYHGSNCVTMWNKYEDISGNPKYDAATVYCGAHARMPREKDFKELRDYCKFIWTYHNQVKGILITGPNGSSIFLPAGGFKVNDNNEYRNMVCGYWTSTPFEGDDEYSHCYDNYSDTSEGFYDDPLPPVRFIGRNIRPVRD